MNKNIKNISGYTLISTLVALSLMLLLLVLVNKTLPVISGITYNKLKIQAINAAKEQMIHTLETKEYKMFSRVIDHHLTLEQEVHTLFSRIYIKIVITHSKTGKELYTLEAYGRPD